MLINGGGPLYTYFVRRCARDRVAPDRICLIEPTYRTAELGSPLFHWLQPLPGYRPEEVVEAFVTDTMMMSHRMSIAGTTDGGSRLLSFSFITTRTNARQCTAHGPLQCPGQAGMDRSLPRKRHPRILAVLYDETQSQSASNVAFPSSAINGRPYSGHPLLLACLIPLRLQFTLNA